MDMAMLDVRIRNRSPDLFIALQDISTNAGDFALIGFNPIKSWFSFGGSSSVSAHLFSSDMRVATKLQWRRGRRSNNHGLPAFLFIW